MLINDLYIRSINPDTGELLRRLTLEIKGATFVGGLPPEASVVVATRTGATLVWQRPRFGMVIAEDADLDCDLPRSSGCDAEFGVLRAEGVEILRISLDLIDEEDGPPFGFITP
jgi:hypothetical protein